MSNSADVAYRMNSEARARAVLKDLSRICKEAGLRVKNASLQEAVARIFGYDDWHGMLSAVGGHETVGPEDDTLDHDALMLRRGRQTDALVRIGIQAVNAEAVLARLRPTGRTASAVAASRRLSVLSNGDDYHPIRFRRVWHDLCSIVDFDQSTYGAEDVLDEWGREREMHPIDAAVCHRPSSDNETLLDLYFRVGELTHLVLDVSGGAAELANREVTVETYRGLPDIIEDGIYVHFGADAFPSPYLHVGIEGAYVDAYGMDHDGGEAPDGIGVKLVCSVPFREFLAGNDWMACDPVQSIRDHLRGPQVYLSPNDGESFADSVAVFAGETANPESDAWAAYVAAPMAAAINAVKDFANKQLPTEDYLIEEPMPEVRRSLERASTDDKLLRAMEDLNMGQLVVRKFGGNAQRLNERGKAHVDAGAQKITGDHLSGLYRDITNYRGVSMLAPALWVMDCAEKHSREGDTPLHHYERVAGRFFVVRTCLQELADNPRETAHLDPGTLLMRDEAMAHVRHLLDDDSIYPLAHMPMLWLASYVFGFNDEAERAWVRETEHGRDALPVLKEVVDEIIAINDPGDFPGVLNWMMGDPFEDDMPTLVRPIWDPWSPELETEGDPTMENAAP